MQKASWRVELELTSGRPDPLGNAAREALAARGFPLDSPIRSGRAYLLPGSMTLAEVHEAAEKLLADPVTEQFAIYAPEESHPHGDATLVVRRLAGVADPEAHSTRLSLAFLGYRFPEEEAIETYRTFRVDGPVNAADFLQAGAKALANTTIEEVSLASSAVRSHPRPRDIPCQRREVPLLQADDKHLAHISSTMSLALSVEEMKVIQAFYLNEQREPTDVELETLAQTWSEHCKHKTLTGPVHFQRVNSQGVVLEEKHYQNLLKETVFEATQQLSPPWCWSVFKDNAGVIAMTDDIGLAIKVETHNHPSALDPYGGAGTGIGGVIRDILGTGLGARPFAATDVFCVGPKNMPREDLPPGTLHPDRVLSGVIGGVRDYGNRMGIPTVCGTVIRDEGYVANPLVFAGCIGEIPKKYVEKEAFPGDFIVALGGRTGRDGIHGATFSSEALHEDSETVDSTAVQIGDPITEKKVLDVQLIARDEGLFSALTDCGAGGFSSAVGEMGEDLGAVVELSHAPLKYPGLSYWEIWISEAQERMVCAVPPAKLDRLQELCALHDVELTVLGTFEDTGRLVLKWHNEVVGDLPMSFLHGAVPQPVRQATFVQPNLSATAWPSAPHYKSLLQDVLAHPSVVSKEWIVRQYDHEVQGGTVVKPYQGSTGHGPGDGSVIKPRLDLPQGAALGCGIAPRISMIDPYAGAACAIDEAIRNAVAAGGNPHRTAILDNFCWGDCRKPDRLGSLVLAADACYDAAIAYGAPFISGKDSLNNEYRVGDEEVAIPPTLLCTAMAIVEDTAQTVTTPLKNPGNLLVLVGETFGDGGGSVASDFLSLPDSIPPCPNFTTAPACFSAMHEAITLGLVRACHDLCEGGLAVAAAEMTLGSCLGARVDTSKVSADPELCSTAALFSETPTRFLVEVSPSHLDSFQAVFRGQPCFVVGEVLQEAKLFLMDKEKNLATLTYEELATANGVMA
jgi:phosphoribosylformylglycinamidine synthase II